MQFFLVKYNIIYLIRTNFHADKFSRGFIFAHLPQNCKNSVSIFCTAFFKIYRGSKFFARINFLAPTTKRLKRGTYFHAISRKSKFYAKICPRKNVYE